MAGLISERKAIANKNMSSDSSIFNMRPNKGSPYKTVEVENSWALSGMGARIKSRHSNLVEVRSIFIAGVKC
jgi:hypothetical protein